MRPKVSAYVGTSIDGFIARQNGDIDWLIKLNETAPKGEDFGYQKFFDTVDTMVMGRKSFQAALSFPEWPYGEKPIFVLSTTLKEIPAQLKNTVHITSDSPQNILKQLHNKGKKHVYVDGGQTIQSFISANLVDEITITTVPMLLGAGTPLFGPIQKDMTLTHLSTVTFPNGFVQSMYKF